MPAKYTVDQIADTLIQLSRERNIEITNLKLQKLLFYAQAWYLTLGRTGAPLFDAEFEAWVHGPVVPSVFRRFKEYRWNAIAAPVKALDDPHLLAYLNEVLSKYGSLSARQLEHLTHQEAPWQEARRGVAPDESSSQVITRESIKRFYSTKTGR